MAMFFLLRHNGKHKSALLDTIDFARGDGPCPQIAAERPHDVFLQRCPETFHNIWKRRHTVSLVLHSEKTVSHPQTHCCGKQKPHRQLRNHCLAKKLIKRTMARS